MSARPVVGAGAGQPQHGSASGLGEVADLPVDHSFGEGVVRFARIELIAVVLLMSVSLEVTTCSSSERYDSAGAITVNCA